jgi:Phage tail tube protein
MADRQERRTVVLAKTEVTYGTDAVPTPAANAMLVSNLTINPLNAQNVERNLIRPFLGGDEELVGTRNVTCSFDVELVGGGAAATPPAWGPLVMACGFAQTITATIRVDYTPISAAMSSLTLYWYDDGVLHILLGSRGDLKVTATAGGLLIGSFSITGLVGTVSAATNPSPTLTAFQVPQVVTNANTLSLVLGGTHATGTAPVITAGTPFPSLGMEFSLGNTVSHNALIGGETVDISDRDVTGKFQLDLTSAQEVAAFADVNAATLISVGMSHGTVVGNKTLIFCPAVQRKNISKTTQNGKRLIGYDLSMVPVSGNDEIRIVTSF